MNLNSNLRYDKQKISNLHSLVEKNFQMIKYQKISDFDQSFYDSIFKTFYIINLTINELLTFFDEIGLSEHSEISKKIYLTQQTLLKNIINNLTKNSQSDVTQKNNSENVLNSSQKDYKYKFKEKKKKNKSRDSRLEKENEDNFNTAQILFREIEKGKSIKLEKIVNPFVLIDLNKLVADDIVKNNGEMNKQFNEWITKTTSVVYSNHHDNFLKNSLEKIINNMLEKFVKDERKTLTLEENNLEEFLKKFDEFEGFLKSVFGKGYEKLVNKLLSLVGNDKTLKNTQSVMVQTNIQNEEETSLIFEYTQQIKNLNLQINQLETKLLQTENKLGYFQLDFEKIQKKYDTLENENKNFKQREQFAISSELKKELSKNGENFDQIFQNHDYLKNPNLKETLKLLERNLNLIKMSNQKEENNNSIKKEKFKSCISNFNFLLKKFLKKNSNLISEQEENKIEETGNEEDKNCSDFIFLPSSIEQIGILIFNKKYEQNKFSKSKTKKLKKKEEEEKLEKINETRESFIYNKEIDAKNKDKNFRKSNLKKNSFIKEKNNVQKKVSKIKTEKINEENFENGENPNKKETDTNFDKISKKSFFNRNSLSKNKTKLTNEKIPVPSNIEKANLAAFQKNKRKISLNKEVKIFQNQEIEQKKKKFYSLIQTNQFSISSKTITNIREENLKKKDQFLGQESQELKKKEDIENINKNENININKNENINKNKKNETNIDMKYKQNQKLKNDEKEEDNNKYKNEKLKTNENEYIGDEKINEKNKNIYISKTEKKTVVLPVIKKDYESSNLLKKKSKEKEKNINNKKKGENENDDKKKQIEINEKVLTEEKEQIVLNLSGINYEIEIDFKTKNKQKINKVNIKKRKFVFFDFVILSSLKEISKKIKLNKNSKGIFELKDIRQKTKKSNDLQKNSTFFQNSQNNGVINPSQEKFLNFSKQQNLKKKQMQYNLVNSQKIINWQQKNNLKSSLLNRDNKKNPFSMMFNKKNKNDNFSYFRKIKDLSPKLEKEKTYKFLKKRKSLNLPNLDKVHFSTIKNYSQKDQLNNLNIFHQNEEKKNPNLEKSYYYKKIQEITYSHNLQKSQENCLDLKSNKKRNNNFSKKLLKKQIFDEFDLLNNEIIKNLTIEIVDKFHEIHSKCIPCCNHLDSFYFYLSQFINSKLNEEFKKIPIFDLGKNPNFHKLLFY